jgi:hypothetical protein
VEVRHSIQCPAHSLCLSLHRQCSTEPGLTPLPHPPSTRLCLLRNEECDCARCMASPLLQQPQASTNHTPSRLRRECPVPPLKPLRRCCLQRAARP